MISFSPTQYRKGWKDILQRVQ